MWYNQHAEKKGESIMTVSRLINLKISDNLSFYKKNKKHINSGSVL